jgi:nucleoside-diphosphate-sugar epimerase
MVMRVFVAGGTGVLGRRLVLQLVTRGHQVTATTTGPGKLGLREQLGAEAVVMDGLDPTSVTEAVAQARPDAIVHQMTGISMAHAGKPDLKHFDRWAIPTIRLRTEGTDHLLAAAEATGVSHFVAQGYANWNGIRQGGWVKTEEDPLDLMTGTAAHTSMEALRHVEDVAGKAGGAVMRYGALYGPGATDDQVELVRKRQFPLVGSGSGYASWVHLDDAASATVLAVEQKARGVFNMVDDEPAPASEWLPYLAECAGAKKLAAALPVVAPGLQGGTGVRRPGEFSELRPLLFSITYRILDRVSEAEDAVQETWPRWQASPAQPASARLPAGAANRALPCPPPRFAFCAGATSADAHQPVFELRGKLAEHGVAHFDPATARPARAAS